MDAYFAAIEIRENPSLKGKPVVVGGSPQSRGVVSTCSYEARKYGIHSGMASYQAWQLCKQAIFVHSSFQVYKDTTEQIREIFYRYTDKVEFMSLDEAYLDVTENKIHEDNPETIACRIKADILLETKLTASAGVSYNKFLAKIGSDLQKPDGLVVIPPEKAEEILFNLPIEKFHGIGKVIAGRMKNIGIYNGKDLYQLSLPDMVRRFGKAGVFYYYVVRGIDEREVITSSEPKSISNETTFAEDSDNLEELCAVMKRLATKLSFRMQSKQITGQVLTIKVKYDNFDITCKSLALPYLTNDNEEIYHYAEQLLINNLNAKRKVRLLGVGLNKLKTKQTSQQIELWESQHDIQGI